jgi:hypothetical protein
MEIKVTRGDAIEAFGIKRETQDEITRKITTDYTGLKAIMQIAHLTPKLRYNLGLLARRLEKIASAWQEFNKDEMDAATQAVVDADGKPVKKPTRDDPQGVPQPVYEIPREVRLAVEKKFRDHLKEMVEVEIEKNPDGKQFDADGKIIWPVMLDPTDTEKDETKKRKIMPLASDMALTMDFIDFSKVE